MLFPTVDMHQLSRKTARVYHVCSLDLHVPATSLTALGVPSVLWVSVVAVPCDVAHNTELIPFESVNDLLMSVMRE